MKEGTRMPFISALNGESSPTLKGSGRMDTGIYQLPTISEEENRRPSHFRRPSRTGASAGASTKLRWSVSGMLAMTILSTLILLFTLHEMPVTPPSRGRGDLHSPRIFWSSSRHSMEQRYSVEPLIHRSLRGEGSIGARSASAAAHGFRADLSSEDGAVARKATTVRAPVLGRQGLRSRAAWHDGGYDDNNREIFAG